MIQTLAVLLTVHNRKTKTLKCLQQLYTQIPIKGYQVDVYLTDDGCTDGTPEAISQEFPQVHIIHGDGNLFWNRGMYTAWQEAAKNNYAFYLWLNDDTFLFENALIKLLKYSHLTQQQAVIVAAICSSDRLHTTYGGYGNNGILSPNNTLQECTTFVGNCVLIPQDIFHKVGNLDWTYKHAIGDLDYGYQVKKAGFHIYLSKEFLGICDSNPQLPAWTRKEVPFTKRIKNLYSPLGYAEPISFFHFERKNFGLLTAIKHFISIHIRVLFPQLWKH